MTTTSLPAGSTPTGPPPPFDPELAAALAAIGDLLPRELTLDLIPAMRQPNPAMPRPSDDDLRRGGTFDVTERLVPGPQGAPDVSLLICRPAGVTTPLAAIYHVHGGGMIIGDNRTGLPLVLSGRRNSSWWWYRWSTGSPRRHRTLAPSRTVTRAWCGRRPCWRPRHRPDRIVIAGGSAGGGLAAAVALMARDRGGPALAGQMLMCPMLDDRNDTPSAVQMACLGCGPSG